MVRLMEVYLSLKIHNLQVILRCNTMFATPIREGMVTVTEIVHTCLLYLVLGEILNDHWTQRQIVVSILTIDEIFG